MIVSKAVEILRSGKLVAFPTETVYGLGADATNPDAIRRIFTVKGRPPTNPLIVHISGVAAAKRYAKRWPDTARRLGAKFWPGPLTLVLPKMPSIVSEATAGRDTVGLRVPDHPLALELLRIFDGPVAAPSANRSNHVSPTTAEHVRQELSEAVDLILDGGPCAVGIESTVLDLSGDRPVILRPGGVSREQIEKIIGPVDVFGGIVETTTAAASPGQHERHYSPTTPAVRFESGEGASIAHHLLAKQKRIVAMLLFETLPDGVTIKRMPMHPDGYARSLYAALREADQVGAEVICIEMPPATAPWLAVRDRLTRATVPISSVSNVIKRDKT